MSKTNRAAAAPTLHEALAAAGYVTGVGATRQYAKRIFRLVDGALVFVGEMTAHEAWTWLRAGCPAVAS